MAAVGEIAGFPFTSATARNLWGTIASSVTRYGGSGSARRSYKSWFTGRSGPLVKQLEGSEIDPRDLTTFQSQVTKLAYFLDVWDELGKAQPPDFEQLNDVAQIIIDTVTRNTDLLVEINSSGQHASVELVREYRARSWRLCELVVVDLEARTSGAEELVRGLWSLDALGREWAPSLRALAEFDRDPGALASRTRNELGSFRSEWLLRFELPPSLDSTRKSEAAFASALDGVARFDTLTPDQRLDLVTELAKRAETLLAHLRGADEEASQIRGERRPSALARLGPEIAATLNEAVRQIRDSEARAGRGPVDPGVVGGIAEGGAGVLPGEGGGAGEIGRGDAREPDHPDRDPGREPGGGEADPGELPGPEGEGGI
jgi:hypothetical protein